MNQAAGSAAGGATAAAEAGVPVGERFVPSTEGVQLEGVIVDVDASTGRASAIESIRVPFSG